MATATTTSRIKKQQHDHFSPNGSASASDVPMLLNASSLTKKTIELRTREPANSIADPEAPFAIDADMQTVLDALAALDPKPIAALHPDEARRQPSLADAATVVLKRQGRDSSPLSLLPGVTSFDTIIPSLAGSLPIRVYMPKGVGPFPVVVYFHGGGWVIADMHVYDSSARGLAKQAHAVVVSVGYRLAPEAQFPAQHDDALAAYLWVCGNAAALNGDPKRLAIAGEGAGGNLAVATAIAAHKLGCTAPLHVLAIYPSTQASGMWTPSLLDCEYARPLNRDTIRWFSHQVFSTADNNKDLRIDLVNAELNYLPPVTLINARIDPLRSDGYMLAAALIRAGIKMKHRIYEGVTHDFFGFAAVLAKAKEAQLFAGQRLMASLGKEY